MSKIIFSVFLVLHGLVHLLYLGQSVRAFELQPGMVWPDGAWAFSKLLGNGSTRMLAGVLLAIAAVGFVVSGLGIVIKQAWWHPVIVSTAVFSALIFILCWDGLIQNLDNKGVFGILIDIAILVAVLVFHWPGIES